MRVVTKRSGLRYRTGDCIRVICYTCKARGPIFIAKYDKVRDCTGRVVFYNPNPVTVAYTEQLAIDAWNRRIIK